jgi:serine/threonine protein kinase
MLESVAGRGGMGVVYRARQVRPDRVVAVKVIAPEVANDPTFCARFRRESTIAAQIEHPNVIPVYAAGEEDGVLFIAMRFVSGTDLRTLIADNGRLNAQRATSIIDQVGQALDAAHSQGLVHRDVKPANTLIAPLGGRDHVYLTDFGLTRHAESSGGATLTGTGQFLGTIDYVAPEQARGERVDARTDVYALGCVLFHALTGTVPFPAANDLGKLFAHATQAPPTLSDRGIAAPKALEEVLTRAMAKEPDDRYHSAGDLGRAAVAASLGESVSRTDRSVAAGDAAPRSANIGRGLAATRPPSTQSTLDSGIMGRGLAATKPPRVPRKPGNPPVIRDRSRLEED